MMRLWIAHVKGLGNQLPEHVGNPPIVADSFTQCKRGLAKTCFPRSRPFTMTRMTVSGNSNLGENPNVRRSIAHPRAVPS